jgi:hypothetical protein
MKMLFSFILTIILMVIILNFNDAEIVKEEIEFDQIYAP